jgi:dienelactone hydrolase
MEYYAPEPGGGPAPLVILTSGCGGLNGLQGPKTIMKNYAAAANRAGAYVAVMDSFASREIDFKTSVSMVCSGMQLRGDERAGDIIAAEALAREHWSRPFTGVILGGWSHGGWTVMELLSAGPRASSIGGFRLEAPSRATSPDAVALFYPYCGFFNSAGRSRWAFKGPLLLVMPGLEPGATSGECLDEVKRARGGTQGLAFEGFPANTHAFDEDDQIPGSEFKYDAEATRRSLALFEAFVRRQAERLKAGN